MLLGHLSCAFHPACLPSQEVFTYIDRVVNDYAEFQRWASDQEKQRQDALQAVQAMRAHPWFPDFMNAVGAANPEEWGFGDPVMEVAVWQEWLHHAEEELIQASRIAGEAARAVMAGDAAATAETQVLEDT